jgi:hypothetical protein
LKFFLGKFVEKEENKLFQSQNLSVWQKALLKVSNKKLL